ncbi:hypothetical protein MCP_2184 [Methanocella paludicola SANAE]|uniref:FAS1 domain-containing protein n=1 Tax=Methanocella paludicola (strain DSM 17711 / JCM 13418 / NBRC 101707 / SANAE) TaxID=304371 RepID=D1Z0N4_METPS|nr:fasciclin domain-containing protein [Methanocella paludicola]BAI62256.1 hypothetical protein MCP_2184 [Methanocella paludicola SANAE]
MDGLRKVAAVFALMVVVLAFIGPAMAQQYGGRMAQPAYQGTQQGQMGQGQMGQGQMGQGQMGQGQQGGLKETNKDLMQTIQETRDVSIFAAAVRAAGYDQKLSQEEGPFMIFAPSDKALNKAGLTDASALSDTDAKSLVESCIVSQMTEPEQGSESFTVTTIGGQTITAKKSSSGITVNGIKVVNVMKADNGMLIVTDGIVGMK